MENKKYWIALNATGKLDTIKLKKVFDFFNGQGLEAWQANSAEFISAGIEEKLTHEIITAKSLINPDEEWKKTEKENVKICLINEEDYPKLLKEIFDPPVILYYRGSLEPLKKTCLAIVGTRKFSTYGKQVVYDLAGELGSFGLTIVSGLALGIDAMAHDATLKKNGLTVAVIGSGVNRTSIYPATNRRLAESIIEKGGAVISEYPIGTEALKHHFPARNRIISGLSLGTLIIEAKEHSGSLITAKSALEQNRNVFAVPGNIYSSNSSGTNNLIKEGATPVTTAMDVLAQFDLQQVMDFTPQEKAKPETEAEKIIWQIISKEPTHINQIAKTSGLKIQSLLSVITIMEINGLIKDLGGKNYVKN